MTVKDLIQELEKHDKDREIIFETLDDNIDSRDELTIKKMEDSIWYDSASRKVEAIPCIYAYLG